MICSVHLFSNSWSWWLRQQMLCQQSDQIMLPKGCYFIHVVSPLWQSSCSIPMHLPGLDCVCSCCLSMINWLVPQSHDIHSNSWFETACAWANLNISTGNRRESPRQLIMKKACQFTFKCFLVQENLLWQSWGVLEKHNKTSYGAPADIWATFAWFHTQHFYDA